MKRMKGDAAARRVLGEQMDEILRKKENEEKNKFKAEIQTRTIHDDIYEMILSYMPEEIREQNFTNMIKLGVTKNQIAAMIEEKKTEKIIEEIAEKLSIEQEHINWVEQGYTRLIRNARNQYNKQQSELAVEKVKKDILDKRQNSSELDEER